MTVLSTGLNTCSIFNKDEVFYNMTMPDRNPELHLVVAPLFPATWQTCFYINVPLWFICLVFITGIGLWFRNVFQSVCFFFQPPLTLGKNLLSERCPAQCLANGVLTLALKHQKLGLCECIQDRLAESTDSESETNKQKEINRAN